MDPAARLRVSAGVARRHAAMPGRRRIVLVGVAIACLGASSARPAPPPCPPGRFLVDPAALPLVPGAGPGDALVVGDAEAALAACGAPDRTTTRVRRRRTILRARWSACGDARRVRLKATLRRSACDEIRGVVRGKGMRRRHFTARRSTCGDGRLDRGRGETCDVSAPEGDAACPGACGDGVACRCPIDGVPGVGGRVLLAAGDRRIPLAGATVSLAGPDPAPPDATTDPSGRFRFLLDDALVPSDLRVCAARDGVGSWCEGVTLGGSDWAYTEIVIVAAGALVGRVVDADGVPCAYRSQTFGSEAHAAVGLAGSAATVSADDRGEWALPVAGPGTWTVEARCAGASTRETFDVAAEDLDGGRTFTLVLPNHAPRIHAVVAREDGVPVRRARPGTLLTVTADVEDPDGDALAFRWFDGEAGPRADEGPTIDWALPTTPARDMLWLEVSDGRGGFATEQVDVATGMSEPRFTGVVVDGDEQPLAGVRVTVNGVPATTGPAGDFRVVAAPATRYAVAVAEPGLAPVARVFDDEAHGIVLRTEPARAYPIGDATAGALLDDPDAGLAVELPPRALVDADGVPASAADAPFTLAVHVFGMTDADPPPGNARGPVDGASVRGAVSVEVFGSSGAAYRLAAGSAVRVTIPMPPDADPCGAPTSEPVEVVHWSDQAATWEAVAHTILPGTGGTAWSFDAASLGTLAVAKPTTTTCLRVRPDRGTIVVPLRVTIRRFTGCFAGPTTPLYTTEQEVLLPDYEWHALTLEADSYYELVVQAEGLTGAVHPGNVLLRRIHTGPATPLVPFPFLGCDERTDLLTRRDPQHGDAWYDGFFSGWYNEGTAARAADYYAQIGAVPAKDTYAKWAAANGFDTLPAVRAGFYNPTELGVGRDVVCRQGTGLACVIAKYGAPGGPVAQTIDDLEHGLNPGDRVAIDWEPGLDQARFYVYGPDGALKPSTHFTPGGPLYVPDACAWCHTHGRFVPLDPNTHLYGPLFPRATQEESIRRLNAMVASVPVSSDRAKALVQHLYPQGVGTPGAVAVDAAPASYQAAGSGAAFVYRQVVRSHCQLCHLNAGPNWLDYAELTDPANAYAAMSLVCQTSMPAMFAPNRNFRQGNALLGLLRGHLVGALPPFDFPWDDHPTKIGALEPQDYLASCTFDTADVDEEPTPP